MDTDQTSSYAQLARPILDEIKGRNAYHLAGDADCATPDSLTSAGAVFLNYVRDRVVELFEAIDEWESFAADETSIDDDDSVRKIADNAPDIYTHTKWQEFVDLAAWQEELETETSDMNSGASIALYQIADRLAWALVREVHEALTEAIEEAE